MSDRTDRLPRHARRLCSVLVLLPVLAACGAGASGDGTTQVRSAPAASAPATAAAGGSAAATPNGSVASPAPATRSGSYVDQATYEANRAGYSTGTVVLFFHAPWCPDCRETEQNLRANPAAIPAGLTVVEVDYDTATDLKKQYGITQQHTFVSINPDGTARQKWTGTHTAAEIAAKA